MLFLIVSAPFIRIHFYGQLLRHSEITVVRYIFIIIVFSFIYAIFLGFITAPYFISLLSLTLIISGLTYLDSHLSV